MCHFITSYSAWEPFLRFRRVKVKKVPANCMRLYYLYIYLFVYYIDNILQITELTTRNSYIVYRI